MDQPRRKRLALPVLGGGLVLVSLVVALLLTLETTYAERLADARRLIDSGDLAAAEAILSAFDSTDPDDVAVAQSLLARIQRIRRADVDQRQEAIALANARRAREAGDWVAAARALDDAGGGDPALGDEVGRKLLELARKSLKKPADADAAEMLVAEAERQEKELAKLLAEAEAAMEAGDWKLADEILDRARRLSGPSHLVAAARQSYEEAHDRAEEIKSREELMEKVAKLLDQGKVSEARTLLDAWQKETGDTSLAVHADALHRLEKQGGLKSYLPVRRALRWLAAHQAEDGGMHGDTYHKICKYPGCTGSGRGNYDPGVTGLTLMAFTAFTELDVLGEFATPAGRTAKYLMQQVGKDGRVAAASGIAQTYTQAIVALALLERSRVVAEPKAEIEVATRIIGYLRDKAHLADGGWRYNPTSNASDVSVSCWVVQALHAAKSAGLAVPDATVYRTLDYLRYMTTRNGAIGYLQPGTTSQTMTPAGLLAKLLFGEDPKSTLNQASARYVARTQPLSFLRKGGKRRGSEATDAKSLYTGHGSFYLWYYQTYSLRMMNGGEWKSFGPAVEKLLVATQETKGHALGSWDDVLGHSRNAGRIYATAMGALTLEVYYRSKAGLAIAPQKKKVEAE